MKAGIPPAFYFAKIADILNRIQKEISIFENRRFLNLALGGDG
ncbi:hypothetical protein [Ligilactobacillus ruminis]